LGWPAARNTSAWDPTGATKQILFEKPPPAANTPVPVPAPTPRKDVAAPGLDVVELASGERLVGKVREVSSASVIVELAGQSISIERNKVRAILFDKGREP